MAGIYIHIPFCRQACHYCNFHFTTSLTRKNELIAALLKEIDIQRNYLQGETIETIYFGGGTPSLLTVPDLQSLISKVRQNFSLSAQAEITLEANPDDISEEKLKEWRDIGINRLSTGIQSFFDEDLEWMNRAHSAEQAVKSLELSVQYFDNITIDLIYGTPGESDDDLRRSVDAAIGAGVDNLSAYALVVEDGTALARRVRRGEVPAPDDDVLALRYEILDERLSAAGFA